MSLCAVKGGGLLALGAVAPHSSPMAMSDFDSLVLVLGLAGGVLVGVLVVIMMIRKLLNISGPHELLVFSGRKHELPDGSTSNYKLLHGGRGFQLPFLEVVGRMDMRLFPVEVTVHNAYSSGGIPLTVRAIANVKLSSDAALVRNAVERFLDTHPSQIALVAQQTLEGVLREVVSQLTPEEVNEDRLKFAQSLMDNARDDFDKLGLELDVLKVQHVADDQEYLSNLGRARIANMLRDAENAENAANQAVAEAKAAAREAAETATKQAETRALQAKNEAAKEQADLEARSRQAEVQAEMAVETARARAEQKLQELRAQLEKLRLHCDVVLPAEAQRKAAELKARGEAAPAVENGKAAAEALKLVAAEWAAAGEHGREVYVLQLLPALVEAASKRVARAEIGNIKMVASDDEAYGAVLASYPSAVARVLRETGAAMGIDIDKLLGRGREESAPAAPRRRTLPPPNPPGAPADGPRTARFGQTAAPALPRVKPDEGGGA